MSSVSVEVHLAGGHRIRTSLASDSPHLHDLMAAMAVQAQGERKPGESKERLLSLPLAGGRVCRFSGRRLLAVRTEPPVLLDLPKGAGLETVDSETESAPGPPLARASDEAPPRDVRDLRQPIGVGFFIQQPVVKHEGHGRMKAFAAKQLEVFRRHRNERRSNLRRLCASLGRRTYVAATFNEGYVPLLVNWAASCDEHGIDVRDRTILFPMDEPADRHARKLGFVTYFDGVSYGHLPQQASHEYGDWDFVRCQFPKLGMVQDLLALGHDVLRQDMDMVWLRDPVPWLERAADAADLDFQCMRDPNTRFQPLYYNSGFVHIRNNEHSRFTWKTIFEAYDMVAFYRSEQVVLNIVMSTFQPRGLRTARLPGDLFVDGERLLARERGGESVPAAARVVHANWTHNLEAKLDMLRRNDLLFAAVDQPPATAPARSASAKSTR